MSFQEIKAKVEEIGKSFNEFQELHKGFLSNPDAVIDASVKRATDDIAKKHEALAVQLEKLAAAANRVAYAEDNGQGSQLSKDLATFNKARKDLYVGKAQSAYFKPEVSGEEYAEYCKAWSEYVRFGDRATANPEIQKALSVGSDPDGGAWLTPPTVMNTIINRIFETSPIRQVATVIPMSTHALRIPENPNEFSAGWVAEMTGRTQTQTAKVAMKEIVAAELYAEPPISQQLLEDSAINVEEWVAKLVADKMSRLENTAFVTGTVGGSSGPRGFLTYPYAANSDGSNMWGNIQQVPSGASGAFTYAGLLNLITSIKDDYQANASFLIKRQSVASIMTLQDGNGRYIFQPILNGEFNNTPLFGYQMRYAYDMPAVAAGALALAFGDFKRGYYIVDRVGMSTIRDNLTAKPLILFYTRKRVGGDVVDYDAIKLQRLTVS